MRDADTHPIAMRGAVFSCLLLACLLWTFAPQPLHAEGPQRPPAQEALNLDPQANLPIDVQFAQLRYSAPIYISLKAIQQGQPFGRLGGPFHWVSIHESATLGNQVFYRVRWSWNNYGWISGRALSLGSLSNLHGVGLQGVEGGALAMVYYPKLNVRTEPGVLTNETLVDVLDAYEAVWILEERWANGALWYRIGDNQWVHSGYVRRIQPSSRPEGVGPTDRWIEINLTEQVAIAHEGDTPLYGTLVSTGRSQYPTVTGLFQIWIKLRNAPMSGGRGSDAYALADVPWVMYFYKGYGLHGTYWHDNFGTVRSHGCVNFSAFDARWFFEFATPVVNPDERYLLSTPENPGTYVWVHY